MTGSIYNIQGKKSIKQKKFKNNEWRVEVSQERGRE